MKESYPVGISDEPAFSWWKPHVVNVRELDLAMCFPLLKWYQNEKPLDQSDEVLKRNRDEP